MFQQVRRYEEQVFQGLQISQVTSSCQVSAAVLGITPGQTCPSHTVAASPIGRPVVGALSYRDRNYHQLTPADSTLPALSQVNTNLHNTRFCADAEPLLQGHIKVFEE